ncbi:RUN domain-containing protein 3B-like [Littorina saxatilis]|uniref:RUN domain-containing protein n=1 Tax=Littorina saxatilis TaxID=31220 RepID=A0AAN9G2D4_9CAEN
MESTDYSLSNRQLEVVRKNLVSVFRFAVKALIDKSCFCSIDDGCEEFINFSASVENILQHRLRTSKMWYLGDNKTHFWFYIKTACRRHDLQGCIINIDNIENIKSPVAKGRAFLRCALMEKRLSEYLSEALKQTNITRRFYQPGAIMLGDEATELCGVLLGLNSIDFGFCLKGENYDTVECPLAVDYTPFMKFKQSQEGLHSDLEEMRELSCGSSLASEDGTDMQETPPASDTWPDRYNALHKRYMRVLEQKSFLEEMTASQEKALQTAAAAQREDCRMQQEAAEQKRQYEGVILELQAQVARMKTINETLQQQLVQARSTRLPLSDMERKAGDSHAEASRFGAAMEYRQESDRHSLNSSYDRGSKTGDTRSMTSAVSEISVDVLGASSASQPGGATRRTEDTQSMVPMVGSLADLQLDLDQGSSNTAVSESSTLIANPEQATPVVSVSSGAYTIAFVESGEINGNGYEDGGYGGEQDFSAVQNAQGVPARGGESLTARESTQRQGAYDVQEETERKDVDRSVSQEVSATREEATEATATQAEQRREETATKESTNQKEGKAGFQESISEGSQNDNTAESGAATPLDATETKSATFEVGQVGSDSGSEHSKTSEAEELLPENNNTREEGEGEAASSDRDTSEPEVLSREMTSSKESSASSGSKDETSEPEILSQGERSSDDDIKASSHKEDSAGGENTENNPQPEIREDVLEAGQNPTASGSDANIIPEEKEKDAEEKEKSSVTKKDSAGLLVAESEKEGSNGNSDAGSSDGTKDNWDMLSDANQDSS